MKQLNRLYFAFLCFVYLSNPGFSQTNTTHTLSFGGLQRTYRLYVPAKYNATQAVPLVLNLHGLGSNGAQQEKYGNFMPIADTANFIIAHPDGLKSAIGTGWNNFGAPGTGVDDLGFLAAMIDDISAKYSINKNRIYSTGMSNGGFMSYDLACFLSTRIAAIASVTGSMIASHLKSCNINRPMPIMEIHGTADNVVSYPGNGGILASTNIDALVKFWVDFNKCAAPVIKNLPDINTTDGSTVEHQVYNNGKNGTTVELYKVIGGGHAWPGSVVGGIAANQDFNACKEIWRFFSKFSLDQLTTIDPLITEKANVLLYPNPATHGFEIIAPKNENYTLQVFNNVGQQVLAATSQNGYARITRGNLAAGVYLVQIKYPDAQVFKKIIFN